MTTYPVQRWNIGAATITRVVEIEGSSPCTFFFRDKRPEQLLQHAWLRPNFLTDDGRMRASIHCFVIQSAGRVIVFDTCVGNDKPREVKNWHMRQGRFLEPTPGHTPGHVSVRIVSGETEAVITGDLMHHPVQCAEPDLASNFDTDADAARRTRRAFLARNADRPALVLGTHFATPTGGKIVRDSGAFRFAV